MRTIHPVALGKHLTFNDSNSVPPMRMMPAARPSRIVVKGHLHHGVVGQLAVRTNDGKVSMVRLGASLTPADVEPFLEREVTIKGMRHDAGASFVIEAQYFFVPTPGDEYFSRIPESETLKQQLERQAYKNSAQALRDIKGKWPGDEDLDTILRMLND